MSAPHELAPKPHVWRAIRHLRRCGYAVWRGRRGMHVLHVLQPRGHACVQVTTVRLLRTVCAEGWRP